MNFSCSDFVEGLVKEIIHYKENYMRLHCWNVTHCLIVLTFFLCKCSADAHEYNFYMDEFSNTLLSCQLLFCSVVMYRTNIKSLWVTGRKVEPLFSYITIYLSLIVNQHKTGFILEGALSVGFQIYWLYSLHLMVRLQLWGCVEYKFQSDPVVHLRFPSIDQRSV